MKSWTCNVICLYALPLSWYKDMCKQWESKLHCRLLPRVSSNTHVSITRASSTTFLLVINLGFLESCTRKFIGKCIINYSNLHCGQNQVMQQMASAQKFLQGYIVDYYQSQRIIATSSRSKPATITITYLQFYSTNKPVNAHINQT